MRSEVRGYASLAAFVVGVAVGLNPDQSRISIAPDQGQQGKGTFVGASLRGAQSADREGGGTSV